MKYKFCKSNVIYLKLLITKKNKEVIFRNSLINHQFKKSKIFWIKWPCYIIIYEELDDEVLIIYEVNDDVFQTNLRKIIEIGYEST